MLHSYSSTHHHPQTHTDRCMYRQSGFRMHSIFLLIVAALCFAANVVVAVVPVGIKAKQSMTPFTKLDVPHRDVHTGFLFPTSFGNITLSGTGGLGAPPCGTEMASYQGISAYSNGDYQGTGESCGDWTPTGYAYQCVEYTQRYFNYLYGIQAVWPVSYASQMCDSYPGGIQPVGYPQAGFGVVFNWGTYGHTAVVIGVGDGTIDVIEENGSGSGTNTYNQGEVLCYLATA